MEAPRTDTCRAHARKSSENAKRAKSQASRKGFLDLAQHWESMADQIEELEGLRRRLSVSIEHRTDIDALFCSLARNAGRRTIGVVLSGMLRDGTLGLKAIKEAGGIALVQAPEEAEFSEMPKSAIAYAGPVDLVGSIEVLAKQIAILVG